MLGRLLTPCFLFYYYPNCLLHHDTITMIVGKGSISMRKCCLMLIEKIRTLFSIQIKIEWDDMFTNLFWKMFSNGVFLKKKTANLFAQERTNFCTRGTQHFNCYGLPTSLSIELNIKSFTLSDLNTVTNLQNERQQSCPMPNLLPASKIGAHSNRCSKICHVKQQTHATL